MASFLFGSKSYRGHKTNGILKARHSLPNGSEQPAQRDFAALLQAAAAVSGRTGVSPVITIDHRSRGRSRIDVAGEAMNFPRWKRVLDIALVLLAFPCWLPVMVFVMLWIKAASRGPVFYRQERIGYRRARFMLFKFRTMHVNAETRTHEEYFAHLMRADCPMTKMDAEGDARLISCGRFLRASGLDELPQIFNVLRGEMSLVGPRPCLPNEFRRYEAWQKQRVNAPPGLTGYWQVNGKNKTTFKEMIAMDIFYGRNMSVWLDLRIILKTIPTLIWQTLELS
jgi:exopolysaccharide production protein ExoY